MSTTTSPESIDVLCMACADASCDFRPVKLARRAPGDYDVTIEMHYCGVCHSDLVVAAGHLGFVDKVQYDCVPGHELAGLVSAVGSRVTKFKVGQKIGVGCMVDSCRNCSGCKNDQENKCMKQTGTYNGPDNNGRAAVWPPKSKTLGGYSDIMVVNENYGILIPETYPLEAAGPVMCAGITMYDPMRQLGVKKGDRIGICGIGGLGVMGIKIAKALGCTVTVISRGTLKEKTGRDAGGDHYINSKTKEGLMEGAGSLDVIINTIPVYHDYVSYQVLLDKKSKIGKQVILGLHEGLVGCMAANAVTFGKSRLMASGIGGIKATQDVINLCSEHNITPNLKVMPCSALNDIYAKLDGANDEGLRYVLDIKNTLKENSVQSEPKPVFEPHKQASILSMLGEILKVIFLFKWL